MERFMNFLEGVGIFCLLAAAALSIFAIIYGCADMLFSKDDYSYATDDGTSGIADFCDNGKGGLYCTKDGRTFTVKEFSKK